jgi:putative tryptophan/tyrosine transport system substrate-binding protein
VPGKNSSIGVSPTRGSQNLGASSMRRREFITGLGGAAAWPLAVYAQPAASLRRVGILMAVRMDIGSPFHAWVDAFKRGLARFGWAEDRNIRFEERYSTDINEIAVHARDLARLSSDATFVMGSPALRAMQRASGDIPIVFASVGDPVAQGFVSSLAHPGGNITGFAADEFGIVTKQLDLLKNLVPTLERVALLYDPDQSASAGAWSEIEAAAPSLALKVLKALARNAEETEGAIAALASQPNSGLLVIPGPNTPKSGLIAAQALRHRLPAIYQFRLDVESGGLAFYGADQIDLCRRAASYVDRILRGERPRDLPVQLPTRFELVLNLKTAKAMGLDIPPKVLALADDVIE